MVTIHQILRAITSHLHVPDENILKGILGLIDEHERSGAPYALAEPAAVAQAAAVPQAPPPFAVPQFYPQAAPAAQVPQAPQPVAAAPDPMAAFTALATTPQFAQLAQTLAAIFTGAPGAAR